MVRRNHRNERYTALRGIDVPQIPMTSMGIGRQLENPSEVVEVSTGLLQRNGVPALPLSKRPPMLQYISREMLARNDHKSEEDAWEGYRALPGFRPTFARRPREALLTTFRFVKRAGLLLREVDLDKGTHKYEVRPLFNNLLDMRQERPLADRKFYVAVGVLSIDDMADPQTMEVVDAFMKYQLPADTPALEVNLERLQVLPPKATEAES